jgi:CRP-like cAMP-binding protein
MRSFYVEHLLLKYGMPVERIRSFFPKIGICSVEAGTAVAVIEQNGACLNYLISGVVIAVTKRSAEYKSDNQFEQPVMLFNEGMWMGAKSVMSDFVNLKSNTEFKHIAVTDITSLRFQPEVVQSMMSSSPEFRDFVMKLCLQEATQYTEMMLQVKFGSPINRVISGLAMIADAFLSSPNAHQENLLNGPGNKELKIILPQQMVAELCGVSRSYISKALLSLQKQGWIGLEYGQTVIRYPQAWRMLATTLRGGRLGSLEMKLDIAVAELTRCRDALEISKEIDGDAFVKPSLISDASFGNIA